MHSCIIHCCIVATSNRFTTCNLGRIKSRFRPRFFDDDESPPKQGGGTIACVNHSMTKEAPHARPPLLLPFGHICHPAAWFGQYGGFMQTPKEMSASPFADNAMVLWDAVSEGAEAPSGTAGMRRRPRLTALGCQTA